MSKRDKLPSGVYYTNRNGGLYVSWNGQPEGQIWYTYDPDTARGNEGEFPWVATPYQGADGSCYLRRVVRLAAEYSA